MADAATKFLGSLSPEQRQQAVFPFESEERLHWNFIPTETFPRKGLTVKEMTEAQRSPRARPAEGRVEPAWLHDRQPRSWTWRRSSATSRSARASGRAPAAAGEAAGRGRGQALVRDPVKYFFTVFGTPSKKATWGWRVEGHHVSLHFDVVNGTLVVQHAGLLRLESGGGAGRTQEGAPHPGRPGGLGACAADGARRIAARQGRDPGRGAQRDRHDEQAGHQPAVARRHHRATR